MRKYTFLLFITLLFSACINPNSNTKTAPVKVDFVLEHKIRMPEKLGESPPLLLLLHGLRSSENDLIPLANLLDERLLVVSARAPFEAGNGRYKWYDYQGNSSKPIINKAQAEQSRLAVIEFIDQLVAAYGIDAKQVFVGGFSQGAMMSYSVGLSMPDKVRGIAAFSGKIPAEVQSIITDKSSFSNFSAFVSHGKQDSVLSFQDALSDKAFLENLGVKTSFHEYNTKHSLSQQNIKDFVKWTNEVLRF